MRIGMDNQRQEVVYPRSGQDHAASEAEHCSTDEGCITCGDVALPLEVVEVDNGRGLALCRDEPGRRESVEIALVLPVEPGDHLLVHAGTAISRITASPRATPCGDAEDGEIADNSRMSSALRPGMRGRASGAGGA